MRLPLYHDAFTILDLLVYGNVHLTRDGSGLHSYTDVDNLIGTYGKFFEDGRTTHIQQLSAQLPAIEPWWVNATFSECEARYMSKIAAAIALGRGMKELTCENLWLARVRLMKDPIKREDGKARFKFEFHPSTRLPKLNAAGNPFRSRDLYVLFEAA